MNSAANGRDKNAFAIAKDEWLRAKGRRKLPPSARWLGAILCRFFNRQHFDRTGELFGYPKYETLMAESGLAKRTIAYAIVALEKAKLLEVEHGRYDREAGLRDRNHYRAKLQGAKLAPSQGAHQGARIELDSLDLDSIDLEKNPSERRVPLASSRRASLAFEEKKEGESEQAREAKKEKEDSLSNSPSCPSLEIPSSPSSARPPSPIVQRYRREEAAAFASLQRYQAKANGGATAQSSCWGPQ